MTLVREPGSLDAVLFKAVQQIPPQALFEATGHEVEYFRNCANPRS